ncbi:MAG: signal peptidase I [Opitutae bacterium]|nr:signal peptidase I [Opitutae bacterium]MBT5379330.1 signal peptidase I [Opitutae bacterium]MBT5690344.1 signal peptidase I [Opitutae bacterium]MBT6463721.1 signal peptidase I [Opitutae bacterium]MBT7852318.1 signal peptidase I [Opitutae bacterium]
MMGMIILYLALCLIMAISGWKVFSKAGKPGIASIIPIWNIVVMVEMAGKPVSWVLLILLVPCANIYFAIMLMIELAKRFGKSSGFGIGLILLPFIFWPMLAFGSAQYQAPSPTEPSA